MTTQVRSNNDYVDNDTIQREELQDSDRNNNKAANQPIIHKKGKKKPQTPSKATPQSATHKVEVFFTEQEYILLNIVRRYCQTNTDAAFIKKAVLANLAAIDQEIHDLQSINQLRAFMQG